MSDVYSSIRALLSGSPEFIKPVGITRFSTSEKPSNRDGWVLRGDDGVYRFGCWRQDLTGSFAGDQNRIFGQRRNQLCFQLAEVAKSHEIEKARASNAVTWNQALTPLSSGVVNLYLTKRGLSLPFFPQEIKESVLDYYIDGMSIGKLPVMLGRVTNPSGDMVAIHRTYLSHDGLKTDVGQPKKLSKINGPMAGSSIKFGEPELHKGRLTLGVAEGIETALACYLSSRIPTWSCVSAGGMKRFVWPEGLQSLIIFGDNDKSGVGQAAAQALLKRAIQSGLECRVLIPIEIGRDWLDVYVGGINE